MSYKSTKAAKPLRFAVSRALLTTAALTSAFMFAPSASAQQQGPSLTPNQEAVSDTLFELCSRLFNQGEVGQLELASKLAAPEDDLADQCNTFFGGEGSFEQFKTIFNQLGAEEFNALRTVTAVFSQSQFQTIRDRLRARREDGGNSAGINLRDREWVADSQRQIGGGAAADEALLGDRLGFWIRGNSGSGEKDATISDAGFEADQWGATVGVDYRFGSTLVVGGSVGYGASTVEFGAAGGDIDIDSLSGSLYGGLYFGNFYLDAVGNYISGDYETRRHVQYVDGFFDTVSQDFRGATDGETVSAGLAAGYNFAMGGFTLTPSISYLYVDVAVDGFRESEGITDSLGYGMNLSFDDQDYKSSTAQATLDATLAFNQSWGVLIPHMRASFVREFEKGVEVFGVRFANDPFVGTSDPTPPIVLQSDKIDRSYFRLSAGASVQFRGAVSGYLEYQRIEGFENVDFQDFTLGIRMQF